MMRNAKHVMVLNKVLKGEPERWRYRVVGLAARCVQKEIEGRYRKKGKEGNPIGLQISLRFDMFLWATL